MSIELGTKNIEDRQKIWKIRKYWSRKSDTLDGVYLSFP